MFFRGRDEELYLVLAFAQIRRVAPASSDCFDKLPLVRGNLIVKTSRLKLTVYRAFTPVYMYIYQTMGPE